MRLVFISDTHGQHEELGTLQGDVLVHSGDFCHGFMNDGSTLAEIDDWFGRQDFDLILCVGGNHDFLAQTRHDDGQPVFQNAIYLVDDEYLFNGISFYGAPWLPDLELWANFLPDEERKTKWDRVPDSVDVLITHTPPFGILDKPRSGRHIGCKSLRAAVDRIRPQVHAFGHVHASPGSLTESGTRFINATAVNSEIEIAYPPTVVEISVPRSQTP